MYRYLQVIFFSIITSLSLSAQDNLIGEVRDMTGLVIVGAHVIVYDHEESIVAFTFTDTLGSFSLKLTQNLDSLTLEVSHLTHRSEVLLLNESDHYIFVSLEKSEHQLPQVVVQVDPVIRRGDTLIFDVKSHARLDDRTLEDVLARLPGITIESNGKILYRGRPISKFYIEGLDMLEGRYKIATQNLGLHNILDVEIIERHQHKNVLRDLERTNQAAINIKLKSKVAYTGSVSSGLASSDPDYSLRGDLFGFTKSFQFVGLGSSNTFGLSERATFTDVQYNYSFYDRPILSVNRSRTPWYIPPQAYGENDEQVLGGMGLIKLGSHDVIKLYSTYTQDAFSYRGSENIRFDIPDLPTLSQFYTYQNELSTDSWSSYAIYEKNGDRLFIKSKNSVDVSHNLDIGKNTYNAVPIMEGMSNKTVEGKSSNEIIFRLPNKALTIYVDLSHKKLKESLTVDTINTILPSGSNGVHDLSQTLERSITNGHLWTGFLWKSGRTTLGAQTGLRGIADELTSLLKPSKKDERLGTSLQNDQALRQFSPYLDLSYLLDFDNREVTIAVPLKWLIYQLEDKINTNKTSANPFLYGLNVSYIDRSHAHIDWSVDYTYREDVATLLQPIHSGFILYSNRNLRQSFLDFNRLTEHSISTSGTYIPGSNNGSIILNAKFTSGNYQLLDVEQFDLIGSNGSQIEQSNNQKRLSIDAKVTGRFLQKLSFIVNGKVVWSDRTIISNDQLLSINNSSNMLGVDLSYLLGQSILTFSPEWVLFKNGITNSELFQSIYKLKYFSLFSNWGALRIEGGVYVNTIGDERNLNSLLNLEWEKEWKKSRTTLIFEINNLTQSEEFVTLEQNLNIQNVFSLGLRPLQLRLRFKKSW